jgi:hypothetical protein
MYIKSIGALHRGNQVVTSFATNLILKYLFGWKAQTINQYQNGRCIISCTIVVIIIIDWKWWWLVVKMTKHNCKWQLIAYSHKLNGT